MFSKLFTQKSGTWSAVESAPFRNPDFCPKIQFFQWDHVFSSSKDHCIGGHGHGLCISIEPVPKSFFVYDLGHFS